MRLKQRIRRVIFDRDRHTCQNCGYSELTHVIPKEVIFLNHLRKDCVNLRNARFPALGLEIDHIIPFIAGGKNDVSNLQVLCSYCNAFKAGNTTDKWKNNRKLLIYVEILEYYKNET